VTRRSGVSLEGDCPFKGGFRVRKAARAGDVGALRLSVCLPQVNLACLKLSLPDGGRRVLLGASRPTEHPLPTPAGNPAGSRPTRTSLWPGQFWGKTDACHKPLGKRHPALVLREPPVLRGGLQSVLFPGEALRANGAPGRAEAVKGRAVSRKAAFQSSEMWPVAAVRVAKRAKGKRRLEWLEEWASVARGAGR